MNRLNRTGARGSTGWIRSRDGDAKAEECYVRTSSGRSGLRWDRRGALMRSRVGLVSTRFTLPLKGRSKEARRPSKIVKAMAPSTGAIGLATAILASSATPAFALATHLYDSKTSSEFGSTPGALGVAIDQSDGSVYVAELNNGSVNKFTATENRFHLSAAVKEKSPSLATLGTRG